MAPSPTPFFSTQLISLICSTFQLQSNSAQNFSQDSIMKIFNWVHRRFVHKDGLPQNGKKMDGGVVADDDDGQFLIDQNSTNGFSGWKGGILTIGTFGYNPILSNNDNDNRGQIEHDDDNDVTSLTYAPEKEQVVGNDQINDNYQVIITDHSDDGGEEEEEYDNMNEDDEEATPLLYAVYARDYGYDYKGLMKMKIRVSSHDDYYFDADTKKLGRTTLADLFSADNSTDITIDLQKKQAPIISSKEADHDQMKKKKVKSSSFANKLDARPIHKLNRLMRRMMKRKIHPAADLAGLNKDDYPTNYSKVACDIGGDQSLSFTN